ncbi:MAG: anthranilate synthase component I, partial [Fimbriimonadaceae bacterium]
GGRMVPVYQDILADMETPLSAYWKLAHDEPFSFLLESVTGGEQLARYSILGARPQTVLRSKGRFARRITRHGEQHLEIAPDRDPLNLLEDELRIDAELHVPGMPKFVGGAVGLFGYDLVRFFERLPDGPRDDLQMDDMAMLLTDSVVVFDHAKNLIRVIAIADGTLEGYEAAAAEIERIVQRLRRPLPELPRNHGPSGAVTSNTTREEFERAVEKSRNYIAAGDCIQIVLSQRFEQPVQSHPVTVYRALRSLNPSPYMFLLRFGDYDVVGASPEILVSLFGDTARVRPIAGTRWRGATPEEDRRLEEELLADEKERAEHIMLVDLGRNDLGRVCEIGSVKVNDLMVIERYSHVMHIVSDVTGTLATGRSVFDLLRASFPAGTVSGAPKVRAMQIIDELEPTRRGPYAGSIGYISHSGDLDMAITIRTIVMKGGKAYVQAGAGVVFDSVPSREFDETVNKAQAALKALQIAQQGLT